VCRTIRPNPRASLVAALANAIRDAMAAGDLAAARIAVEALGRLLASEDPTASVVDLRARRAKSEL